MADEKKEETKSAPVTVQQVFIEIAAVVVIALIIGQVISGNGMIGGLQLPTFDGFLNTQFGLLLYDLFDLTIVFIRILCIFLFLVIAYAAFRTAEIKKEWDKKMYPEPIAQVAMPKNEQWQTVIEHAGSDTPSDWRLAILEADIILDGLLDKLGYIGDTIGEKLKKAAKGDFKTLDEAWEAHRVRNAIAHEGQDFVLTQRDALRVIGMYEKVFREFDYI